MITCPVRTGADSVPEEDREVLVSHAKGSECMALPWLSIVGGILKDYMRRQVVTDIRVPNSIWKRKVSDTLSELNIIPENFSGKVVISFKDGGVSYIEKTETFK